MHSVAYSKGWELILQHGTKQKIIETVVKSSHHRSCPTHRTALWTSTGLPSRTPYRSTFCFSFPSSSCSWCVRPVFDHTEKTFIHKINQKIVGCVRSTITNPPSICPMSIAGFRLLPTSITMSTFGIWKESQTPASEPNTLIAIFASAQWKMRA